MKIKLGELLKGKLPKKIEFTFEGGSAETTRKMLDDYAFSAINDTIDQIYNIEVSVDKLKLLDLVEKLVMTNFSLKALPDRVVEIPELIADNITDIIKVVE